MPEAKGFGLYVHWPFCQAKCPYCDFNSHVVAQVDHRLWADALCSEIARYSDETGPRVLNSIFFGGGTPSLMDPATVARIVETAGTKWHFANDIEITLEANPTSVEAEKFRKFRDAGANRVSIGVQSLRDDDLRALGRLHSVDEAKAAITTARETFSRVSYDLIYARQHQTVGDWQAELTEALEFGPDHLSLYQLTIEDGTAFGDRFARGGLKGLPDSDASADMYEITQELTALAGLPAYEISNHASPGQESLHNCIYWKSGDWVGVGPGAHGRLTFSDGRYATESIKSPHAWIKAVTTAGSGESSREGLTGLECFEEGLMMGLRMTDGVPDSLFSEVLENKIKELIDDGLLDYHVGTVRATSKGRPVLNYILRRLLA